MKQLPIIGGAPRGKRAGSDPEKASPRGRASHRNMQCRRRHCGIRDPRRMGRSAPSKHKLRPGVGAPTRICSARGAIVGAATRGESGGLPAQKHKLRPEVGAPTENMQCRGRHCGIRDPRRMGRSARSKHKLRPGVGPPTENMQCTRHHCGSRDPRRMRRSARSKAQASPEVGPPTEKYAVHAAPLWEARPAANAGLPAQQHKLRPGGGAPTENMQCTRRVELADVDRVPAIERVLPKGLPKMPC